MEPVFIRNVHHKLASPVHSLLCFFKFFRVNIFLCVTVASFRGPLPAGTMRFYFSFAINHDTNTQIIDYIGLIVLRLSWRDFQHLRVTVCFSCYILPGMYSMGTLLLLYTWYQYTASRRDDLGFRYTWYGIITSRQAGGSPRIVERLQSTLATGGGGARTNSLGAPVVAK